MRTQRSPWLALVLIALVLGTWLVTPAAAQNFIWGAINGIPFGPGLILSGPLLLPNGTVGAPAEAYFLEPSSGWYRAGAGDIRLAILGADVITAVSNGQVTLAGSLLTPESVRIGATKNVFWNGRGLLASSADKSVSVLDNLAATGMELNVGTPTLGTCTAGSLTSGSHNFAGEITGNTSGSCIVSFGTPNFTNTPICFAMSRTSTTHPRISAASASSITITGGVSGEAIGYHCDGRIGV